MAIRPIFLFSITRSGSTLVQRVVAAHDGVATTSEPWLLLPYLYALRDRGVTAEYTHGLSTAAIEDFCAELPNGVEDYRRELHDFVLRLYEKAAGPTATHFLDKTPPYYFIADEIMRLFPEAKFVFLWRNPLSIVASIVETWHGGRWHATSHREDLFIGLPRLVATYRHNRPRAHAARFEDLVGGQEHHWRALMTYLEIPFDPLALERFSAVRLGGRMGDPTGVKQYATLSPESTVKWRSTLGNPLRKAWCRRYLRFLGTERLATMGYDGEQLAAELDLLPTTAASLLPDLRQLAGDVAREPLRVRARRHGIGGPNVLRELLRA
jgi:hypothetical protein